MRLGYAIFLTLALAAAAPVPTQPSQRKEPNPVMCTMDVKICADGSAVARSGPKCEFALCPAEKAAKTGTKEAKKPTDG